MRMSLIRYNLTKYEFPCCYMYFTGPIDHDAEVEDSPGYREEELGGVEEHKSIILHLLSQLKLGMDLTKVCTVCVWGG